jgi:uncharacterized protein
MYDIFLIFLGGMVGSTHCLGMCGPLALALGLNQPSRSANLRRQLLFSSGRLFTYGCLGVGAGFFGFLLRDQQATAINLQAMLALLAGLGLAAIGLATAGIVNFPLPKLIPTGCGVSPLMTFLRSRDHGGVLLAGVLTGFLPCGLVYAFLALCASTGQPLESFARMIAFGAGTVPMMVAAGVTGGQLGPAARTWLLRVGSWSLIVTGVLTIARGVAFLTADSAESAACPFCSPLE